jgi:hypothetical protein
MTVEIFSGSTEMTFRQRWSHYLALIFAGIGLLIGMNLRDSTLNVTTQYTNPQAGISAQYPQNWLLQEGGEDFVFRVSDTSTPGYNTSIQVAIRPVSSDTSARNIFDSLTLARAQTLAKYEVISEAPFVLPDETTTGAMTYVFVASPTNPFLQSIPVVVEGIDILIVERGQAIIVSFLSSADSFEANLPILQEFLRNLEF